jgi:hypoxanthine phosphoribosyltransferase
LVRAAPSCAIADRYRAGPGGAEGEGAVKILYTEEEIAARIEALAGDIAATLPKDFLMAPVLTGAFIFAADLLRALHRRGADPFVDFVQLSSYGGARASSGVVHTLKDFSVDLEGRDVLIVDDVLDTGRSLHFAKSMVLDRGARSARLCVLVRKATGRSADIEADFVGFEAGADEFLVGYGMDDAGRRRGLAVIGAA